MHPQNYMALNANIKSCVLAAKLVVTILTIETLSSSVQGGVILPLRLIILYY